MTQTFNLETLTSIEGFRIKGANSGDGSGTVVSGAGDVNGDGYADIIVGAPTAGRVYIVFGNKTRSTDIDLANLSNNHEGFTIFGESSTVGQYSVSSAGDMNKDGYDDIVIGATIFEEASSAGKCYVVYGKSNSSNIDLKNLGTGGFYIFGSSSGDQLGTAVSKIGNLNNDGIASIIVGAPQKNSQAGVSYVIFGKAIKTDDLSDIDINNINGKGLIILGANPGDLSGSAFASGDIDGDGYDDIVIGAHNADPQGRTDAGATYIIWGNIALGSSNQINLAELNMNSKRIVIDGVTGQSGLVVSVGKINNDKYHDIIIGTGAAAAKVYVVYGSQNRVNLDLTNIGTLGFDIDCQASPTTFRIGVQDINNDTSADIIIGQERLAFDKGHTYVVIDKSAGNIKLATLGSKGLDLVGAEDARSGCSVSGVGDINNDGYGDIIIGSFLASPNSKSGAGESYVIYGSASGIATSIPTSSPTVVPTLAPTHPTSVPTEQPTAAPTKSPTLEPSFRPTKEPTSSLPSSPTASKDDGGNNNNGIIGGVVAGVTGVAGIVGYIAGLPKYICIQAFDNWSKTATVIPDMSIKNVILYPCALVYQKQYFDWGEEQERIRKRQEEIRAKEAADREKTHKEVEVERLRGVEEEGVLDVENQTSDTLITRASIDQLTGIKQTPPRKLDLIPKRKVLPQNSVESDHLPNDEETLHADKRGNAILSIDAMMDPEHVRLQSEEFERFGKALIEVAKELLMIKRTSAEADNQAVVTYHDSVAFESAQFSNSDNLMISLLSTRQMIEYIPLVKYITQSSLDHFGYDITLPEVLDSKTTLLTTHLLLGNAAAQFLPADFVTTGMIVSNIGTGAYGIRLLAADYLKTQAPTDEPMEIAAQCGTAMLLYNLPNIATFAAVQALLPGTSYAITGYDVLASSSLGAIHCSSNYKPITEQSAELTTADNAVPLIIDAGVLLLLGSNLQLGAGSVGMLMLSIKNCMSVLTTVYAADSVTRVLLDFIPQEVKQEYVEPICDAVINNLNDGYKKISGLIEDTFKMDSEV